MVVTATTSKQIRQALKVAGFGPRDVSVRNDSYSMGSTVHVRIKRAEIAFNDVHSIAVAHENVRRDSTGEILGGGNTYIEVSYERNALDAHIARAQAAIDAGRFAFGEFHLSDDSSDADTLHLWRTNETGVGTHVLRLSREHGAGKGLARMLASHGRLALLDTPPTVADVAALARAWQQAYPCPADCAELAALWQAVATLP
jgi:hypothetical protein